MVRDRAGGPISRVADVSGGVATLQHVDQHGRLHIRQHFPSELLPWWHSTGPRCLWPETREVEVDAPVGFFSIRSKRKNSTKPKTSRKIKRRTLLTAGRFDAMFPEVAG